MQTQNTTDPLNDFAAEVAIGPVLDAATTHQPRQKRDETVGATTMEKIFIAGFFLAIGVLVVGGIGLTVWAAYAVWTMIH